MKNRFAVFIGIFVAFYLFVLWLARPPFRLHRKLLAKLPYVPENLLVTDLDDDGHPEVMALKKDKPPIWVRFPFDKPSRLRFENCRAVWDVYCRSVLKALPVLTAGYRLRLLRWKDGKANLDPFPFLPDVLIDKALVSEGEDAGTVLLEVHRGNDRWFFTLSSQGEWQFSSRFTSPKFTSLDIADLADLDRDGMLDALCIQDDPADRHAWVFWGGRRKGKTNLGVWMRYGCPQVADLDGDGWMEIVMVDESELLKIWRFDRREGRLKVIATSSPSSFPQLFDLDGDGRKEIVVHEPKGSFWVFQWRDGRLRMWKGKTGLRIGWYLEQVKFGDRLALYGYQRRLVWLFPPRIWMEGGKLRWQFREEMMFIVFALLPRGEQAFYPSNWRFQEAPFELRFAGDIDGDGSDEMIGYDGRWRRWRLYRAEVTKSGKLRWRDVLLGREYPSPRVFALLVDGKRRGLVVAWEDGRLELLSTAASGE